MAEKVQVNADKLKVLDAVMQKIENMIFCWHIKTIDLGEECWKFQCILSL